jgi:hypothetical protein
MYPASEWRVISGRMMMIRACLSLLIATVVKRPRYATGFQARRLTVFLSFQSRWINPRFAWSARLVKNTTFAWSVNKGEPTATFLGIVRDVVDRFRGTSQSPSPMLPFSPPSKLAEILEFPNAPEESHVSQWVKIGDDALAENARKKK